MPTQLCIVVLLLASLASPALAAQPGGASPPPTVSVRTSLKAAFQVESISARSELSADTVVTAQLRSLLGGKLNAARLLGQRMTFTVRLAAGQERHFDGFVTKAVQTENAISVTLQPSLALLRKRADLVPFHDLNYAQVIKRVLARHPFVRSRITLRDKYPKRPFTLQYRETDRNFVDRVLEQVGIYYFYEHDARGHRLVLADHNSTHRAFGQGARFVVGTKPQRGEQLLSQWSETYKLAQARYTLVDHDQRVARPKQMQTSWLDKRVHHPFAKLEMYDFPGEFETLAQGKWLARLRAEELSSTRARISTAGRGLALVTGYLIDVAVRGDKARRYLVVSDRLYWSGGLPSVSCLLIPHTIQFRPQRRTSKPNISGLQIATVAGKSDARGWVRLRFRWARKGQLSGWVRAVGVKPPAAGSQVLVAFAEGDPDRPLILGTLHR